MPIPELSSNCWRNVVFPKFSAVRPVPTEFPNFERRYRMVEKFAEDLLTSPVFLLEGRVGARQFDAVHKIGLEDRIPFYNFALAESLLDVRSRALAFERLLVHRFILQRLSQWDELVDASLTMRIMSMAETFLIEHFRTCTARQALNQMSVPVQLLCRLVRAVDAYIARRLFCAMRAEKVSVKCHGWQTFVELGVHWRAATRQHCCTARIPSAFQNTRMAAVLERVSEKVHSFRTLELIPFYRRYFRLIEIMRSPDFIERFWGSGPSLCEYAFQLSQADSLSGGFIPTFVRISALLMKSPEFMKDCDNEERTLWYKLEAVVTDLIQKDSALSALYWNVHDMFLVIL
jgi:hypothetical protein